MRRFLGIILACLLIPSLAMSATMDPTTPADSESIGLGASHIRAIKSYLATRGVDVTVQGAVGNGTTDDYTAIQAAITAASTGTVKRVVLPPGNYLVGTQLTVPAGTTDLEIVGEGSATITCNNLDQCFVSNGSSGSHVVGLTIRNIRFAGTSARTVMFIYTDELRFEDNEISGATKVPAAGNATALYLDSVNIGWIERNYIHDNGRAPTGINTATSDVTTWNRQSSGIVFRGNRVISGNAAGTIKTQIAVQFDATESTFDSNYIDQGAYSYIATPTTLTDGVAVAADATLTSATASWVAGDVGSEVVIVGAGTAGANLITRISSINSPTSIELESAAVTSVNPATIRYGLNTNNGYGLTLYCTSPCSNNHVTRNKIKNAAGSGIYTVGVSTGLVVTDNILTSVAKFEDAGTLNVAGIAVSQATQATISNNIVNGSGKNGIGVNLSSHVTLSTNEVYSVTNDCYQIRGTASFITLVGNIADTCLNGLNQFGAGANEYTYITAFANIFRNVTGVSVYFTKTSYSTFIGNVVDTGVTRGIGIVAGQENVIANSVVRNIGSYSISYQGTLGHVTNNLVPTGNTSRPLLTGAVWKSGNVSSIGASQGTAVLINGTVTVSTVEVLTGDYIVLSRVVAGGTLGDLSVGTIVNATSFVINSASALDTSTIFWQIVH